MSKYEIMHLENLNLATIYFGSKKYHCFESIVLKWVDQEDKGTIGEDCIDESDIGY